MDMKRIHRITPKTIQKFGDLVWVDVWHIAGNDCCLKNGYFRIYLLGCRRRKYFEKYWGNQGIFTVGYLDELSLDNMIEKCCQIIKELNVPINRFHFHGSTIGHDEWLQAKLELTC